MNSFTTGCIVAMVGLLSIAYVTGIRITENSALAQHKITVNANLEIQHLNYDGQREVFLFKTLGILPNSINPEDFIDLEDFANKMRNQKNQKDI